MNDKRPYNNRLRFCDQKPMSVKERRAIRKLIVAECANYDSEYGCLPLDCSCPMLTKIYTDGGCRYFFNSVLPLDKALMASLNSKPEKKCKYCGKTFPMNGKQIYCDLCKTKGKRAANAAWMRKHRTKVRSETNAMQTM